MEGRIRLICQGMCKWISSAGTLKPDWWIKNGNNEKIMINELSHFMEALKFHNEELGFCPKKADENYVVNS